MTTQDDTQKAAVGILPNPSADVTQSGAKVGVVANVDPAGSAAALIASHHHTGGSDGPQVSYPNLLNIPASFTPAAHKTSHEPGGADVIRGLHRSSTLTYITGAGLAGIDNTAMTIKTVTLLANTLTQVGDRMRVRTYWTGDTGTPVTGSVKLGPTGSEVLISHTTDGGAATLQLNEAWLHYIDNTHANIIENEAGSLGALSAPNVAGFTWNANQDIIFTQDKIANNRCILYALIVDIFPKGIA